MRLRSGLQVEEKEQASQVLLPVQDAPSKDQQSHRASRATQKDAPRAPDWEVESPRSHQWVEAAD